MQFFLDGKLGRDAAASLRLRKAARNQAFQLLLGLAPRDDEAIEFLVQTGFDEQRTDGAQRERKGEREPGARAGFGGDAHGAPPLFHLRFDDIEPDALNESRSAMSRCQM